MRSWWGPLWCRAHCRNRWPATGKATARTVPAVLGSGGQDLGDALRESRNHQENAWLTLSTSALAVGVGCGLCMIFISLADLGFGWYRLGRTDGSTPG